MQDCQGAAATSAALQAKQKVHAQDAQAGRVGE